MDGVLQQRHIELKTFKYLLQNIWDKINFNRRNPISLDKVTSPIIAVYFYCRSYIGKKITTHSLIALISHLIFNILNKFKKNYMLFLILKVWDIEKKKKCKKLSPFKRSLYKIVCNIFCLKFFKYFFLESFLQYQNPR